jgi:hypothetical protein
LFLKLCGDTLRLGDERAALNWLHEAHNLGRDNVRLHVATHFRYVRFSMREGNYRRALGHVFWALTSPLVVPVARNRRTAIVGEWTPAPRTTTIDQAQVILLVDEIGPTGVDGRDATILLEAAPNSSELAGTSARTAPLSLSEAGTAASADGQVSTGHLPPSRASIFRAPKYSRFWR